jgi:hypothetical protein
MNGWRVWARIGVGGTLVLAAIILLSGFINGDWAAAWGFFFLGYFWIAAWLLLAVVALGFSGLRRLTRSRFAKPS